MSQFCGICDTTKLLGSICDYHIRAIAEVAERNRITMREAARVLYTQAIEDARSLEE